MTNYLLRSALPPQQRYAYIGIPHDSATSLGNPGGRFAPAALRESLRSVFDWRLRDGRLADVDTGIIDLSAVEVVDWGDVALNFYDPTQVVEQSYAAVQQAIAEGYVPLIVGGDHSISYPPIKALHDAHTGKLGLIQLDAHNDLMDFSDRQGHYSGSSGMRRSLELERIDPVNLAQVGLRGYTTVEQYEIGERLGVHRISATRFTELGTPAVAAQALAWAQNNTDAVYLTIDMDVINPGEAPGTGWPEPGGLAAQQVIDFVRIVAPHIAALDIAELNPLYDTQSKATMLLAARLILDFITVRASYDRVTG